MVFGGQPGFLGVVVTLLAWTTAAMFMHETVGLSTTPATVGLSTTPLTVELSATLAATTEDDAAVMSRVLFCAAALLQRCSVCSVRVMSGGLYRIVSGR